MKYLSLANSDLRAKVDDEDFDRVNKYVWHVRTDSYTGAYMIYRRPEHFKQIQLKREIMGLDTGRWLHVNGDFLDCRKANLRGAYAAQDGDRKYQGVWYDAAGTCPNKKWRAYIRFEGKRYHLGWHATFEDAREARKAAERKFYPDQLPPTRKRAK